MAAPEALPPLLHTSNQEALETPSGHEEQVVPEKLQAAAKRRQLTVMSVELVDAAVLTVALDPEALHGLIGIR